MANASAALRFVIDTLHWPLDGIKLLGRSLGTAPCMALAAKYEVAGMILVAPFLSIREIFRSQVGRLADLVTDRFPNYLLAEHIVSPTLIVHGQMDTLIPFEHGRQIYESLPSKKMMVCPAGMGHNSCLLKDVSDFVLPMTQFFSLPDYTFEELILPSWVFPKLPEPLEPPSEPPTPELTSPRRVSSIFSDGIPLDCRANSAAREGSPMDDQLEPRKFAPALPEDLSPKTEVEQERHPHYLEQIKLDKEKPMPYPSPGILLGCCGGACNAGPRPLKVACRGPDPEVTRDTGNATRHYDFRTPPQTPRVVVSALAEFSGPLAGRTTSRYRL